MFRCVWLPCLFLVAGCAQAPSSGGQFLSSDYKERQVLHGGVFSEEEEKPLGEAAIQALLDNRIVIAAKPKMAVFKLRDEAPHRWAFYSSDVVTDADLSRDNREYQQALEGRLMDTGKLVEVSPLPSLLLSARPTIRKIRDAAALTQASLLLIYRGTSELVTEERLLARDRVKAHASVEILLLDVRTGAIPYTRIHEADAEADKDPKEVSIMQTQYRVDKEATLKALHEGADGLAKFLDAAGKAP